MRTNPSIYKRPVYMRQLSPEDLQHIYTLYVTYMQARYSDDSSEPSVPGNSES